MKKFIPFQCILASTSVFLLAFSFFSYADIIEVRDKGFINGRVIKNGQESVEFEDSRGVKKTLPKRDVLFIQIDEAASSARTKADESQPWLSGSSGYEVAASKRKPYAMYFFAGWCGYCKLFEKNVLNTSSVTEFLRPAMKVKVDADRDGQLLAQFDLNGIPHFFVISASGGRKEMPTGASPAEFISACRQAGLRD